MMSGNKAELLNQLEDIVKNCRQCRLCTTATHAVPGEGDPNAEIVFIGEAPGENEDRLGRPFVGRAGKLLEALLSKIDYTREQVWIGNIIKHRPPANRDPLPDELLSCSPFLTRQLEILQPPLIVTLGRFSMNYLYPEGKITRDHGSLIKTKVYNVYPVYHPAAALRSTEMYKTLETDFMRIPQVLKNIKTGTIKLNDQNLERNDGQQSLF